MTVLRRNGCDLTTMNERTAQMWRDGFTVHEIADALGVTHGAVSGRISRLQERGIISPRGKDWKARPRKRRPVSEVIEADATSIERTRGRYVFLRQFAEEHGLTYAQVLQQWHRVRGFMQ